MNRGLFLLVLLFLCMTVFGEESIIYYTQSRLFIVDLDQEATPGIKAPVRPFVVIPNRSLGSLDKQQSFFLSVFNFKNIILKKEVKELKWLPRYRNKRAVFPRLIQTVQVEENQFDLTLIPFGEGVSIGYRIQVSIARSLPEENKEILSPLSAVYDVPSEGILLNAEIRDFGDSFFVCFPVGRKMYILSFCDSYLIGSEIY